MDSRYDRYDGATFSLAYHIVWHPKYRRPVLVDAAAERLRVLPAEKSAELGMTIHALEATPDHVNLFVESDPTRCVAEIVNRLKGYTSRMLRQALPPLRPRLPTLWSRSCFAGSVGQVSAATIERSIAEPKGK